MLFLIIPRKEFVPINKAIYMVVSVEWFLFVAGIF